MKTCSSAGPAPSSAAARWHSTEASPSAEEVLPPIAEEVPDAPAPDTQQGGIHLLPYINLGRSPEGNIGGQIGLRFGIFRNHHIRFGLDCI